MSRESVLYGRGNVRVGNDLGREVGKKRRGEGLIGSGKAAEEVKVQRTVGRVRSDQRRARGSVNQDQKMKGARQITQGREGGRRGSEGVGNAGGKGGGKEGGRSRKWGEKPIDDVRGKGSSEATVAPRNGEGGEVGRELEDRAINKALIDRVVGRAVKKAAVKTGMLDGRSKE